MRFDISAIALVAFLAPAMAAKTWDVSIENGKFSPQELNIAVGDTVRWSVNDGVDHAIVEISAGCDTKAGGFNSGRKAKAQAYLRTFPTATVINYKDGIGANCLQNNATGVIYVGPRTSDASTPLSTTSSASASQTRTATSSSNGGATLTSTPIASPTNRPNGANGMLVQSSVALGLVGFVGALVAF
ncbi:hypothetical protein EDD11_006660 [Mortierella claussenii]|nr:hypothetical protein EDD11_006660 [Mortierella claussenii]